MVKSRWKGMSVEELENEARRHNRLYFVDNRPEISDYDFDQLVRELRLRKPDSPVLSELVSDIRGGAKVRHGVPMLSLDKCYDEKSILDWASKFEGNVVASPKIDGCAVSLVYGADGNLRRAATRGDGVEGEEITANVRRIASVPKELVQGGVEIRGEIYMPLSVFRRFKDEFSNPRNLAAGAIKQKDASKTAGYGLSFFAYDVLGLDFRTEEEKYSALKRLGFGVVEWRSVDAGGMQSAYEYFLKRRDEFDFETDGVVFKANDVGEQERLGATAHHPRYAIAYKFQGDSGTTALIGVEWSVSRTGAITPVAVVEPVKLSGATVKRASLHNVGIMNSLGIGKGARVLMMRRGGVIPNVESVVKPGGKPIEIPAVCPSCGSPTELKDDVLYCTKPAKCVRSKIGELSHFVKTVGIDGFGDKLLGRLYDAGIVTDASELYELTEDELLGMERMGDVLALKLVANISAKRKIPLSVFLQSLGIRELGRHVARVLSSFESLDRVLGLSEEELSDIHTIGPVIAKDVVSGLAEKRHLIDKLLCFVDVVADEAKSESNWRYAGKSFLFTGKLVSMERSKAERAVEERGGVALSSVTKALDYLVVGDGGGAGSKLEKAKKLSEGGGNVKIISEKEFLEFLEG